VSERDDFDLDVKVERPRPEDSSHDYSCSPDCRTSETGQQARGTDRD
jgi:hypothetical protein